MIETERLLLKPLSQSELIKHIKSPADLADEMGLTPSDSLVEKEAQEAILNDLLPNLSDNKKDAMFYTMWIMIKKKEKAIIGGFCFHGEPDENRQVEIGYGTDAKYRNKGYMTEAIKAIALCLREDKHVKTLMAETDKSNISSIRVLEKCGFQWILNKKGMVIMKLDLNY